MLDLKTIGYAGKILRVNLSDGDLQIENLEEFVVKKWVGGVGLGAKYLYDEVPTGVEWSEEREAELIGQTVQPDDSHVAGAIQKITVTERNHERQARKKYKRISNFFNLYKSI